MHFDSLNWFRNFDVLCDLTFGKKSCSCIWCYQIMLQWQLLFNFYNVLLWQQGRHTLEYVVFFLFGSVEGKL
jgi:hypothetical protein